MAREEIVLKFKVEFDNPEYNAEYEFNRHESPAFAYGNGTAVTIWRNGTYAGSVDTRYDRNVVRDFEQWCKDWMKDYFDPSYHPKFSKVVQNA